MFVVFLSSYKTLCQETAHMIVPCSYGKTTSEEQSNDRMITAHGI